MSPEPASSVRVRAAELPADNGVEGPFKSHHHETYVIPLPGRDGGRGLRVKVREPRENVIWFDRRSFLSEEELLRVLSGRVARVPDVIDIDVLGMGFQRYIEGRTLGSVYRAGRAIPGFCEDQLIETFGEMARMDGRDLPVRRRCDLVDRVEEGDSAGFLDRLVLFAEERVYRGNIPLFGDLFHSLGIDDCAFKQLRKWVPGLSSRPFHFLHGDLHRENLILDSEKRVWVIDWELAMLGDPLYDLATHLYLMRYPAGQARRVTDRWAYTVESVRCGASRDWERDLPLVIDFKRAQSVFTDVIRSAMAVAEGDSVLRVARRLRNVLVAGARPLALEQVPSWAQVAAALQRWRLSACL